MIEIKNLEIGYVASKKTVSIYKQLNYFFKPGELVGLIGNNGIGKSTLLKTLTGNLKPLAGSILIDTKPIIDFTDVQLAQLISIVTTEKIGGFNLTVYDVVSSGRTPYINIFATLSKTDETIINTSLEQLQITQLKLKLMDELSDGQRQKVMIAKALAQETPIIILDEPTAFLDYNSKHHLFSVLKKLCQIENKLIIVSSHDLDLMNRFVDRTLEMV